MRTYEERKELISKWFTKEEIAEIKEATESARVLYKHPMYRSDFTLFDHATHDMADVADEKECIAERTAEFLDACDISIVNRIMEGLNAYIGAEVAVDEDTDISLDSGSKRELYNHVYEVKELIKFIVSISQHDTRARFLERSIGRYKVGVVM